MARTRFRDFDWTLFAFVLAMSVISVLEIRSATAMTKFHGFQVKQMGFILVGIVLMFAVSLVDYHRLWTSPTGPTASACSRSWPS
jgi:rod shape determining protein RodA